MEVLRCIRDRRSTRHYQRRPVEEERLMRVLEAGRLAPSASNLQEWRYVVVRNPDTLARLAAAASNQQFIASAPIVIACCAETDGHLMRCGQPGYTINVAISVDHMTLQAVEEGLGSCWVGAFDEAEVKRVLGIPERVRVVELLTLGYPSMPPSPRSRKSLQEIVHFEKW